MSRLGAEAWLVAAVIWISIMLPSAAFGAMADHRAPLASHASSMGNAD